jgi:hypothetical protein
LDGLMAKEPDDRFPSAAAVIEAIRAVRAKLPATDDAPQDEAGKSHPEPATQKESG